MLCILKIILKPLGKSLLTSMPQMEGGCLGWSWRPKPRSVEHPTSLLYPHPNHEPCLPNPTPVLALVTLKLEVQQKNYKVKELTRIYIFIESLRERRKGNKTLIKVHVKVATNEQSININ